MGQARRISQAMVVGTREETRHIACTLIEESGFNVIEAETLDEAADLLMLHAKKVTFVFAEARDIDEARKLGALVASHWPWIRLLVSLDRAVTVADWPANATRLHRPWRPLDLLIETERALH